MPASRKAECKANFCVFARDFFWFPLNAGSMFRSDRQGQVRQELRLTMRMVYCIKHRNCTGYLKGGKHGKWIE